MSRPRKPYGPNPPGRLLATMIKVLAAELSDSGRLARGKRYWADDAVVDITIGHGAVTAEIQGSRAQPYVVTLEATGGTGVPARRDLWVQCTCPDDTRTGADACKHVVAALFALSDEVAIEPELIDRWRAGRRPLRLVTDDEHDRAGADDAADTTVGDVTREAVDAAWADELDTGGGRVIELDEARRRRSPELDAIAQLLASPTGAMAPERPEPDLIDQSAIRDRLLAEVLDDALDHLQIRWE